MVPCSHHKEMGSTWATFQILSSEGILTHNRPLLGEHEMTSVVRVHKSWSLQDSFPQANFLFETEEVRGCEYNDACGKAAVSPTGFNAYDGSDLARWFGSGSDDSLHSEL